MEKATIFIEEEDHIASPPDTCNRMLFIISAFALLIGLVAIVIVVLRVVFGEDNIKDENSIITTTFSELD